MSSLELNPWVEKECSHQYTLCDFVYRRFSYSKFTRNAELITSRALTLGVFFGFFCGCSPVITLPAHRLFLNLWVVLFLNKNLKFAKSIHTQQRLVFSIWCNDFLAGNQDADLFTFFLDSHCWWTLGTHKVPVCCRQTSCPDDCIWNWWNGKEILKESLEWPRIRAMVRCNLGSKIN